MIQTRNTVTVVDDDESYARALERRLRASGFDVCTYPSAEALLSPAGVVRTPDCFVLDVQLGGMTGLELFRRLREVGSTVPVIFVTAHDAPGVREEAERVGCAGYFSKPVPGVQLVDAIHEAIQAVAATKPEM